ncbi:hypothetical protein ACSMXM_00310 [Pacificimonas sp. ICDLI1SI03]
MIEVLEWYGAIAGAIAAFMISLNPGTRKVGWAFVIFVTSSIALIAWGFLSDKGIGIGVQNCVLLIINLIGVWRHLGPGKPPEPAAEG